MGSTKNVLAPFLALSAGDMSGNLNSTVVNIKNLDNVGIQFTWTGSPTGTFGADVSLDNTNWNSLTLSPVPSASGSAGTYYLDLNQLSAVYLRSTYAFTSGTGTLSILIAGKGV